MLKKNIHKSWPRFSLAAVGAVLLAMVFVMENVVITAGHNDYWVSCMVGKAKMPYLCLVAAPILLMVVLNTISAYSKNIKLTKITIAYSTVFFLAPVALALYMIKNSIGYEVALTASNMLFIIMSFAGFALMIISNKMDGKLVGAKKYSWKMRQKLTTVLAGLMAINLIFSFYPIMISSEYCRSEEIDVVPAITEGNKAVFYGWIGINIVGIIVGLLIYFLNKKDAVEKKVSGKTKAMIAIAMIGVALSYAAFGYIVFAGWSSGGGTIYIRPAFGAFAKLVTAFMELIILIMLTM